MNWFDADDRSAVVFPPEKHIAHRFPEEKDRVLPERAVVSPDFGGLQRRLITSCADYVLCKQKGLG